jgi:hypothetical protein
MLTQKNYLQEGSFVARENKEFSRVIQPDRLCVSVICGLMFLAN